MSKDENTTEHIEEVGLLYVRRGGGKWKLQLCMMTDEAMIRPSIIHFIYGKKLTAVNGCIWMGIGILCITIIYSTGLTSVGPMAMKMTQKGNYSTIFMF